MPESELLSRFVAYIIEPAMYILFAAGLFLFVWGLVQFLWNLNEGSNRQEGIDHMKWGIVGMFIMVSFMGIIMLLNNTFDFGVNEDGTFTPDMTRLEDLNIEYGR